MYKPMFILGAGLGLALTVASCGKAGNESPSSGSEVRVDAPTSANDKADKSRLIPFLSDWPKRDGTALELVGDANKKVYRITVAGKAGVYGFNKQQPVKAGDTITVNLMMWSDVPGTEARIRIARFCGAGEVEQTVITRNMADQPRLVALSHTFENDQGCARLQFDSRQDEATFFVSDVKVTKD
ncbi:MAG: hypothetical protein ABNH53_08945 [Henriciella sp.]|jgi:hypothetical protein